MQYAGLTFGEMQNRVALELDLTVGSDGLPTSAVELKMVRDAINDTISQVYGEHEFAWCSRERTFAIGTDAPNMIQSDPTRYALPSGAEGQPSSKVAFAAVSGGQRGTIYVSTVHAVRERLNDSSSTGTPLVCAFHQPLLATLGGLAPWEMVVYPSPAAAYNVTAKFESRPHKLVMNEEKGPWGAECDWAIVAGAKRILARRGKLSKHSTIQDAERQFADALAVAIVKDKERFHRGQGEREVVTGRGVIYSDRFTEV